MKRGDPLTLREKDIVKRVCRGDSPRKISYEADIDENTVRAFMYRARKKLGAPTTLTMVLKVQQIGLDNIRAVPGKISKEQRERIRKDDDNS